MSAKLTFDFKLLNFRLKEKRYGRDGKERSDEKSTKDEKMRFL